MGTHSSCYYLNGVCITRFQKKCTKEIRSVEGSVVINAYWISDTCSIWINWHGCIWFFLILKCVYLFFPVRSKWRKSTQSTMSWITNFGCSSVKSQCIEVGDFFIIIYDNIYKSQCNVFAGRNKLLLLVFISDKLPWLFLWSVTHLPRLMQVLLSKLLSHNDLWCLNGDSLYWS